MKNTHPLPAKPVHFPVAEGVGIFIGVVAWDLLSEGAIELLKAALIAVPTSLIWYAARLWKQRCLAKPGKSGSSIQPKKGHLQ
ncbi:hypothetical protein [Propionivibrio limicola]|uniref:hypothetical protein n=1 Tax=Propionivibrio limicola TaxID=167645 RepID=UPI0012910CF1|nr:hypothetical protein [Propionivibrio limicola]